jgi:hypothetical protein
MDFSSISQNLYKIPSPVSRDVWQVGTQVAWLGAPSKHPWFECNWKSVNSKLIIFMGQGWESVALAEDPWDQEEIHSRTASSPEHYLTACFLEELLQLLLQCDCFFDGIGTWDAIVTNHWLPFAQRGYSVPKSIEFCFTDMYAVKEGECQYKCDSGELLIGTWSPQEMMEIMTWGTGFTARYIRLMSEMRLIP